MDESYNTQYSSQVEETTEEAELTSDLARWEDTFAEAKASGISTSYIPSGSKYPTECISTYEVESVLYGRSMKTNFYFTKLDNHSRLQITDLYSPTLGKIGSTSVTMQGNMVNPPVMTETMDIATSPIIDSISKMFVPELASSYRLGDMFNLGDLEGLILEAIESPPPTKDLSEITLFLTNPKSEKITYVEVSGSSIVIPLNINHRIKIKKVTNKGYTKYSAHKFIKKITLLDEV